MNINKNSIIALLILLISISISALAQQSSYLLSFNDSILDEYGYINQKGDTIIPSGKYPYCFTDTFRTYAIVLVPDSGFVAIDRSEKILYKVFPFDNGPDDPSDGLFRIVINHKIGYADSKNGKIVIKPQFACAWPFENGIAMVAIDCQERSDGEHVNWQSDSWFYISKSGKKVKRPIKMK